MAKPEVSNRRPLAVRQWPLFAKLAAWLANVGITPNTISVSSMVFGSSAGGCLVMTSLADASPFSQRMCWLAAAGLVQLRLIANLLDGMVAIEGGKKSAVGNLYNEVPDRISDTTVLVGAGYALGGVAWLGYLAAIVALFVAYTRALGASVGAGQQFMGPMAKQQRMAIITAVAVLHATLPAVWIEFDDGQYGLMTPGLLVIVLGGCLTSIRRLHRIASFLKQTRPA